MAEVYLALSGELPALRSLVVVKRILPHLSAQDEFIRMFLDEARIGALLDHPNIVRIIEVGRDGDGTFLAMEPVQGKPLSAVLRRAASRKSPLEQAQAAFIVGQAANGLGYAHALTDAEGDPLNVVHRDISPQNILVSFEGAVKVIDFGVASALGRLTETVPGGLKGKIEYMSPEQASGGEVDRRSDIFALGVVLWEALSGRRLFRRGTELETMRAILDQPIPRPPRAASVPPRLERIVMRALERDPEDRFQDAREMSLVLQQHAFASVGFNLIQLAAYMKRQFAADHAGWKAATSAALDLDSKRPRRITASFSFANTLDSHTAEPTVALRGDSGPGTSSHTTREEEPSAGGASCETEGARPTPPRSPSRFWRAGSIALLGLICAAGSLLFARLKPTSSAWLPMSINTKLPMVLVPIVPPEPLRPEAPSPGQAAARPPASPTTEPASPSHATGGVAARPAVRPQGGPSPRTTDLRRRAPARRRAKATASKRRSVAVHRQSAPATTPARPPEDTATTRAPWHDPFD
jgi:eukaryotic-like serine/threonine-protein kinase